MKLPLDTVARNRLVENHLWVVDRQLRRYHRLQPALRDDLYQAGAIGLQQAANVYDPARGIFSTYASPRVWGAMKDCLRREDPLSRSHRAQLRTRGDVLFHYQLGIAHENGGIVHGWREVLFEPVADTPTPEQITTARDDRENCKRILYEGFTRGERLSATLYYFVGLTMREVGVAVGVSEARICQLLAKIRKRWIARGYLAPEHRRACA